MSDEKLIGDEVSGVAGYIMTGILVSFFGGATVTFAYEAFRKTTIGEIAIAGAWVVGALAGMYAVGWLTKLFINRIGVWLQRGGYL